MRQIYAVFCTFLVVISLPFMAVIWVGGFISALFTLAGRSGFRSYVKAHNQFSEDSE